MVVFSHWPAVVNASVSNPVLHYLVHVGVVATALIMWTPVAGPLPELRFSLPVQMIYLFLQSIIPTVPAGWLTFADAAVYNSYDIPTRVFGLSVTHDQQIAGMEMKVLGGVFLWTIITVLFVRFATRSAEQDRAELRARRGNPVSSTGTHAPPSERAKCRLRPSRCSPGPSRSQREPWSEAGPPPSRTSRALDQSCRQPCTAGGRKITPSGTRQAATAGAPTAHAPSTAQAHPVASLPPVPSTARRSRAAARGAAGSTSGHRPEGGVAARSRGITMPPSSSSTR